MKLFSKNDANFEQTCYTYKSYYFLANFRILLLQQHIKCLNTQLYHQHLELNLFMTNINLLALGFSNSQTHNPVCIQVL